MKLCVENNSFRMETLWKFKTTEKFNVLKVATLFKQVFIHFFLTEKDINSRSCVFFLFQKPTRQEGCLRYFKLLTLSSIFNFIELEIR